MRAGFPSLLARIVRPPPLSAGVRLERIASVLGVLVAAGPVSTDIYLPAFPAMQAALGGGPGSAQATLAVWFAGLAAGQITQGALSDRFGRRAPLLIGLLIYTLASIGCALAPGIWSFCACRLLAALGASASMVVPSACIRDLSDGHRAVRMLSRLILIMGVVPVLAPTVGGLMLHYASWRLIFWACALYGLLSLALVAKTLPETLPEAGRRSLSLPAILGTSLAVLRERSFITNAMVGALGAFLFFTYLGAAPLIFIRGFGLSPRQFGALFGLIAMTMIALSQLNGLLASRLGPERLLSLAIAMALCGSLALVLLCATDRAQVVPVVVCVMVALGSLGVGGPNSTAAALARHARHAGTAAALIGTLQYLLGAAAGIVMGVVGSASVLPMALVMLGGALAMLGVGCCRPGTVMSSIKSEMEVNTRLREADELL